MNICMHICTHTNTTDVLEVHCKKAAQRVPCCALLTSGTNNDLNLDPAVKECDLPHLTAADISHN